MNIKLTLTIDKKVIERAKLYAKEKKLSLSDIIENYLKILTVEKGKRNEKPLSPIVKSLKGSFQTFTRIDYKKELKERLVIKYS